MARCAVRAAFSGAILSVDVGLFFPPALRGWGHRSAMSLPKQERCVDVLSQLQ
jgi:hypothetical protein